MRRQAGVACGIAAAALLLFGQVPKPRTERHRSLTFEVQPRPFVQTLPRIGVNLGSWTSWGSEQLSRNVLKNPGFEGHIDRAIVIVRSAEENRFTDSETWLARPDGFWSGATAHVLAGRHPGDTFQITDSNKTASGFPVFETESSSPGLRPGDVVALTKRDDSRVPELWWPDPSNVIRIAPGPPRPGSPGVRSLHLNGSANRPATISSYLDMIGDRAGKLLPVEGEWKLSFWYRSEGDQPHLNVLFRRHGGTPFLTEEMQVSSEWSLAEFRFRPVDSGPPGPLELRFTTHGGRIWIDDVTLTELSGFETPFRKAVLDTLRELRPGYLRDWQGQLGDTASNRLAPQFARRTTRYRPGEHETQYHYSLPEFIDLCAAVDANPWIVVPTTLSNEEARSLGRYLHSAWRDHGFDEVLVEFGNENWNALFRPAAIPDPVAHGSVAERILELIRGEAGPETPLHTVVNGQFVAPHRAAEFASNAPSADVLAVAPYYLHQMQDGLTRGDHHRKILGESGRGWQKLSGWVQGREMAVYEVNAHALGGNASTKERTELVTGRVSGTALIKALLAAAEVGVRRQCVYTLSGYDAFLPDRRGLVKLFGITRTLAGPGDFRPTGLAVVLINRLLPSDLHEAQADGPGMVDVVAFRRSDRWSFIAVSESSIKQSIAVVFPGKAALPEGASTLVAGARSGFGTGATQIVRTPFVKTGRIVQVTVPPFGVVVGGVSATGEIDDVE